MGEAFGKGIIASALLSEAKFWPPASSFAKIFGAQRSPIGKGTSAAARLFEGR